MRRNSDRTVAILVGVTLGFTGCATTGRPVSELTPLQIRYIQTRDYEVMEKKVLIQAVMGQLQDDGYIIKEANGDLGFLTARKEEDLRAAKSSGSITAGQAALGTAVIIGWLPVLRACALRRHARSKTTACQLAGRSRRQVR